jgi:hypothetical protein
MEGQTEVVARGLKGRVGRKDWQEGRAGRIDRKEEEGRKEVLTKMKK